MENWGVTPPFFRTPRGVMNMLFKKSAITAVLFFWGVFSKNRSKRPSWTSGTPPEHEVRRNWCRIKSVWARWIFGTLSVFFAKLNQLG